MNSVFADSFYFFALLNDGDPLHAKAVAYSNSFRGLIVTSKWILTEVADGLSRPGHRELFLQLYQELLLHPRVRVIPHSEDMFESGLRLYSERSDKAWSLTDCISFSIMKEQGVNEALTGDRHFDQAGFTALLKG